jgi:hypothetical protein
MKELIVGLGMALVAAIAVPTLSQTSNASQLAGEPSGTLDGSGSDGAVAQALHPVGGR